MMFTKLMIFAMVASVVNGTFGASGIGRTPAEYIKLYGEANGKLYERIRERFYKEDEMIKEMLETSNQGYELMKQDVETKCKELKKGKPILMNKKKRKNLHLTLEKFMIDMQQTNARKEAPKLTGAKLLEYFKDKGRNPFQAHGPYFLTWIERMRQLELPLPSDILFWIPENYTELILKTLGTEKCPVEYYTMIKHNIPSKKTMEFIKAARERSVLEKQISQDTWEDRINEILYKNKGIGQFTEQLNKTFCELPTEIAKRNTIQIFLEAARKVSPGLSALIDHLNIQIAELRAKGEDIKILLERACTEEEPEFTLKEATEMKINTLMMYESTALKYKRLRNKQNWLTELTRKLSVEGELPDILTMA